MQSDKKFTELWAEKSIFLIKKNLFTQFSTWLESKGACKLRVRENRDTLSYSTMIGFSFDKQKCDKNTVTTAFDCEPFPSSSDVFNGNWFFR